MGRLSPLESPLKIHDREVNQRRVFGVVINDVVSDHTLRLQVSGAFGPRVRQQIGEAARSNRQTDPMARFEEIRDAVEFHDELVDLVRLEKRLRLLAEAIAPPNGVLPQVGRVPVREHVRQC